MTSDGIVRAASFNGRVLAVSIVVIVLGVLGLATELWFKPWFRDYFSVASRAELTSRVQHIFYAISIIVASIAAWEFWFALRVLRVGQWPLPNAFVLRDTPVQRGTRLRVRIGAMFLGALCTAGVAIYAALFPAFVLGL